MHKFNGRWLVCLGVVVMAGCAGTPPARQQYLVAKAPTDVSRDYAGERSLEIEGRQYICQQLSYRTSAAEPEKRETCFTPQLYAQLQKRGMYREWLQALRGTSVDGYARVSSWKAMNAPVISPTSPNWTGSGWVNLSLPAQ